MEGDLFRSRPAVPGGGILSVSALTARIKGLLEGEFRSVRVEGEVSNYKLYPSGHRYFTLKDGGAQIRVVLFRGRDRFILGEIRDGQTVVVSGSIGVFEKKGEYQIYAHSAEVRGLGSLLLELERRKALLASEGLFDPARKRPLPQFPARIGIVTSRQGAVLRDMVRVARGRWPSIGITLAPAQVQGEGAAADIAAALAALSAAGNVDLIIVGRGGGSVEDLWAFNEEPVVRGIAASPVPTISAVGHETDFTLSDLAADHRAATPTAAAQAAVPDRAEFAERVAALVLRAGRGERHRRETLRREHRIAAGAIVDPRPLLRSKRYAAADATDSLARRAEAIVRKRRERTESLSVRLRMHSPAARVSRKRGDAAVLLERAARGIVSLRDGLRGRAGAADATLVALDPAAVLSRGYAIATRKATGRAIRAVSEAVPGEGLDIRVSDGAFGAVVEEEKRG